MRKVQIIHQICNYWLEQLMVKQEENLYEGQVAVGAVVLNRVKSSQFPNTIAGVIYQKGALQLYQMDNKSVNSRKFNSI